MNQSRQLVSNSPVEFKFLRGALLLLLLLRVPVQVKLILNLLVLMENIRRFTKPIIPMLKDIKYRRRYLSRTTKLERNKGMPVQEHLHLFNNIFNSFKCIYCLTRTIIVTTHNFDFLKLIIGTDCRFYLSDTYVLILIVSLR